MYPLKTSSAITVAFFAHDISGDAVTGLVDGGFTKRISKNGAAFGAMTVTITEMENGFYSFPLSAAHSDTAGILTLVFTHGSAKQINLQFRVHANLPDDLATNLATVDTNVDAILVDTGTTLPGTLATAAALATVDTNVDSILVDTAEIGAAGAGLTTLATAAALATVDTNVDAILVDTGTTLDAALAVVDANIDAVLVDTGTTLPATLATIDGIVDNILVDTAEIGAAGAGLTNLATAASIAALNDFDPTAALTESYAADGATFSTAQALYMLHSSLSEFSISGTTLTAKQLDGSTTAMTFTLDDATNPTSRTRAT